MDTRATTTGGRIPRHVATAAREGPIAPRVPGVLTAPERGAHWRHGATGRGPFILEYRILPSPWIVRHRPRLQPRLRLFCFPYAGAGASAFRIWPEHLPPEVEVCAVQPPGRESRFRETPFTNLDELVLAAEGGLRAYLEVPFAFFGHSLGAWTAFELARRLHRQGLPGPVHLLVSGRRAPSLPERLPWIHHLPDDQLLGALQLRYGGIPPEIAEHADLMRLLLPCLRADLQAVETHPYRSGPRLHCRITVFGGIDDPVTTTEELQAWRDETTGISTTHLIPGGHFFLHSARVPLLEAVQAALGFA